MWGAPKLLAYVASKGAVISMTRSLAREFGAQQRDRQRRSRPASREVEATAYVPAERHEYYLQGRALTRGSRRPTTCTGPVLFLSLRCRALRDRPVAAGQRRLCHELILSNREPEKAMADADIERKSWDQPAERELRRNGWTRASRAYATRRYDWDALKFQADYDPEVSAARRCAMSAPAAPASRRTSTRCRPSNFTFSTMVIPAGNEGPPHLHTDVEEMFFVIRGKLKLIMREGRRALRDHPERPRPDLGAARRVPRGDQHRRRRRADVRDAGREQADDADLSG